MENVNILTKDIFLRRGLARVTKGDMDAIINAFKNKHTINYNNNKTIKHYNKFKTMNPESIMAFEFKKKFKEM